MCLVSIPRAGWDGFRCSLIRLIVVLSPCLAMSRGLRSKIVILASLLYPVAEFAPSAAAKATPVPIRRQGRGLFAEDREDCSLYTTVAELENIHLGYRRKMNPSASFFPNVMMSLNFINKAVVCKVRRACITGRYTTHGLLKLCVFCLRFRSALERCKICTEIMSLTKQCFMVDMPKLQVLHAVVVLYLRIYYLNVAEQKKATNLLTIRAHYGPV